MSGHRKELIETFIPNEESITDFFSMKEETKIQVIQLGMLFYKEGMMKTQLWDNEKWENKLKCIEQEHLSKLDALTQSLEQERQSFTKYKTANEKIQNSMIEGAVDLERQRYEKQITSLQNTNVELLSKMNTLHTEVEKRYAERMVEMDKTHQEIITKHYEKQQDIRNDYEMRLSRQQNSSLKGKDGECMVYEKLNMLFPNADIEDTHSKPHRGDFIVCHNELVMMIETKNYSRNVQKSEIDKFYNDIDNPSNSDIQCGLFVSLNTGICNKDDFQFEIRNNIPVMFIHNLLQHFDSIAIAAKFFRMVLENKQIDLTNKETLDAFKNSAICLKRNFQKQKTHLDRYYNTQLEIITNQQILVGDLFGILKQKF
jgi:hypothetical protein